MDILLRLRQEFSLTPSQAENTVKLIDDGNTIPFIARYRKEMTGSMDDQTLRAVDERLKYLRSLDKRREEVLSSVRDQEKLTPEFEEAVAAASTLAEIEDLYRPYRPKRRTRGSVAREKGLEPFAELILSQRESVDPIAAAEEYVSADRGVLCAQDALDGACDIIAEDISDDASLRKVLRAFMFRTGVLSSHAGEEEQKKDAKGVYSMYYDFTEPVNRVAGHRVLACDRGEREGILKVTVDTDRAQAVRLITDAEVKGASACSELVRLACADSFDRLIRPSLEREIRSFLTEKAAAAAIKVFAVNLRQLLLQPPVKGQIVLGLDPAYRTGCKTAVVDATGKVLDVAVIYPTPPQSRTEEAKAVIKNLVGKHGVTVISIGNGTASRETEIFVASLLPELGGNVSYMVVSEAGASVYSASKLAAEEFPMFDVSLRSAVSIARRLQDPLAELVKIDPKAIGVGQYQHDMPQKELDEALGGVVEDCVNSVGADLNTASASLLSHVAGINKTVAKNIVAYREENGRFSSRKQLLSVPKLGDKAYQQCAGFLRVSGGSEPLDATAVHPESYAVAKKLLSILGVPYEPGKYGARISDEVRRIGENELAAALGVGVPTLRDIVSELIKPGRDPRDELPKPLLRTDILDMKDLKPGMEIKGTVRNIVDFGAFVDIGVHEDGLLHISQICDRFIRHPSEVLSVGDIVTVRVLSADTVKKRISLTMKDAKTAGGT